MPAPAHDPLLDAWSSCVEAVAGVRRAMEAAGTGIVDDTGPAAGAPQMPDRPHATDNPPGVAAADHTPPSERVDSHRVGSHREDGHHEDAVVEALRAAMAATRAATASIRFALVRHGDEVRLREHRARQAPST